MSDKGMSQSAMAAACWGEQAGKEGAAGPAAIDFYCSGKTLPDGSTLTKLANVLGVPENELLPQMTGNFGSDHPDVRLTIVAGQPDRVHISWDTVVPLKIAIQMIALYDQGVVRRGFTDS